MVHVLVVFRGIFMCGSDCQVDAIHQARYHKFENARLENVLLIRGRVEDVAIQTVMPGFDVGMQVNFPKLPRLELISSTVAVSGMETQTEGVAIASDDETV